MRRRLVFSLSSLSIGLSLLLLSCSASSIAPTSTTLKESSDQAISSIAQAIPTPTVQEDLAQVLPISAEAEVAGQVIQLEVARTPLEQSKGLMYRPVLPDDRGMLFPFDPPRPVRFWMMDTPQPLDMVFLLDGEVKAVVANALPCTSEPCPTYGPGTNVNQVIELRSGRAAELGLKKGDRITIRFLDATNSPSPNSSPTP